MVSISVLTNHLCASLWLVFYKLGEQRREIKSIEKDLNEFKLAVAKEYATQNHITRQKAVLEQTLETLRQETSKIKENIGSAKDRLEELKIQKQINEMEKQLRKKEEGLFFEQMRIEATAEDEIEQLCSIDNIEVKLAKVFRVMVE